LAVVVTVSFNYNNQEIARLSVAYGLPVESHGDLSWLDFENFKETFRPFSPTLGHAISWEEDCEEWTRSLASAYADTSLQARVLTDTARGIPFAVAVSTQSQRRQRRKRVRARHIFLTLWAVLAVAIIVGAVAIFTGKIAPAPLHVPAPTPLILAAGPATALILPAKTAPQLLKSAQVKALITPLNQLVRAYNQWVSSCIPLSSGHAITPALSACMLPALTQMNTLVNGERVVVRALEGALALGSCRLALSGFDQQLYSFHLGLAQAANALSVSDHDELALGLTTIDSARTAVAASDQTSIPAVCT
jgi:hypothetical protein